MAFLTEDRDAEGLEKIYDVLAETDFAPHPLHGKAAVRSYMATEKQAADQAAPARMPQGSIEEEKRQKALAAGKHFRVPEWWRGEKSNFKVAQSMMGQGFNVGPKK